MRTIALLSALAALTLVPRGVLAQEPDTQAPNESFTVAALGGVEGYTGDFAPLINPGPSWGVLVNVQPTPVLGLELRYSGASNPLTVPVFSGGRVVRNGAGVNVKLAVPATVEPYVFGGVAVSRANVTDVPEGLGYVDDTFGSIPVGAGLSFHAGALTAGVRGGVDFAFNDTYLPVDRDYTIWNGLVELGATF